MCYSAYRNIRLAFGEDSVDERTVNKSKAKVEAELDVSPITVFRHLSAMDKVKKIGKVYYTVN